MQSGAFLYVLSAALCLGVAGGLLLPIGVLGLIAILVGAIGIGIAAAFYKKPPLLFITIVLLAILLGILRAHLEIRHEASETLSTYIGQTAEVVGRVVDDPDRRETSLHLILQVEKINDISASGGLLVLAPRELEAAYNGTVVIDGKIEAPQSFETDAGHTFDYPGYLRARGISATMQRPDMQKVVPGGTTLLGSLFLIKHSFEESLERLYPEPDGPLLEGILLGEKHGIPKDLTQSFIQSGLIHVVVLSGYNITIVSEGVFRLLSFLPRTFSTGLGGVLMILFALMSGAGAATVRALVMGIIALLARYWRRPVFALRSLSLAVVGMVLWKPEALLHDSGFILSVLATFGLITLSPWVESKIIRWKIFARGRFIQARSTTASTVAVQLFVLPALLYFSGVLSFLAVPANVLALPVVPLTMLLGFIAGLLGFITPILAFLPALASDLLLKWMIVVANTTASLPLSTITIGEFSPWFLIVAYIPLTWFAIRKYSQTALP